MSTSTRCQAANPSLCSDPRCPERQAHYIEFLKEFAPEFAEPGKFKAPKTSDLRDQAAFLTEAKFQAKISSRIIVPSQKFDFDLDTKLAFTDGDCGDLALALHELTGWPIVGSNNHYYCIEPSGRKPIDVLGIHTVGEPENGFDVTYDTFAEKIDPEIIRKDAAYRTYPGHDPRPIAARILEIYKTQFKD